MNLKYEFKVDTVMENALMLILSAKALSRTKTTLDKYFFRSEVVVHNFSVKQSYAHSFGLIN